MRAIHAVTLALAICFSFVGAASAAGGSSGVVGSKTNAASGLITPDVATSLKRHLYWRTADDGTTMVCPSANWYKNGGTCIDESKKNRWVSLQESVPAGKTYAGFQLVGEYIVVYWR